MLGEVPEYLGEYLYTISFSMVKRLEKKVLHWGFNSASVFDVMVLFWIVTFSSDDGA
jgi:hypothetical protein